MITSEGMAHREVSPGTDDDDVIHTHARHRVDNHGDRAKARKRYRRTARRTTRQQLRNGNYESE